MRQIHFRHELPLIRARVETYVKDAVAGKLDTIRREAWDQKRNAAFDRDAAEFAADVEAVGNDQQTLQWVLDKFHIRKRPRPLTWAAAQIQGMQVSNVTIEEIALRGASAEVLLALDLKPSHPDVPGVVPGAAGAPNAAGGEAGGAMTRGSAGTGGGGLTGFHIPL